MNDLIQVIKFLDDDQLDKINTYIDTLTFEPSLVFAAKEESGDLKSDNSIRSSTVTFLDEDVRECKLIHSAMNNALDEYKRRVEKIHSNFSFYPVPGANHTSSWREGIQILEYSKGQHYRFHHDAAVLPHLKEYHRQISVILYLKESEIGGGTAFPHTLFKPKPGYGLIFPSNWSYPHSGEPVERGKKRVAVTWYYVECN